MNNRQLYFGLLSGFTVMMAGLLLALDNIIPWSLCLTGAAICVLNLSFWNIRRQPIE